MKNFISAMFIMTFQCFGTTKELVDFMNTLPQNQQAEARISPEPSSNQVCLVYWKPTIRYIDEAKPEHGPWEKYQKPDQAPK